VLKSPEARDLKVFVVGHTDDRAIAKKPGARFVFEHFDLSTSRAQAVADFLRRQGLEEQRLGVAGFGSHEPIAPNVTSRDRQKNRRVEIFVMAPEVRSSAGPTRCPACTEQRQRAATREQRTGTAPRSGRLAPIPLK